MYIVTRLRIDRSLPKTDRVRALINQKIVTIPRREALIGGLLGLGLSATVTSADSASVCRPEMDRGPLPINAPEQVPAHEGRIDVDGASLWYWDTGGSGEAIVLLHPLTGSGLVWAYQQPVLARAGYRVIGYSRRGFYNSTAGDLARPGTAAGDARALLDALNIQRCHLVGSAGGAFVVADFAHAFPERLHSQVLACSMLGIQGGPVGDMSGRLRPEGFDKLPEWCQELSPSYRAVNAEGTEHWRALQAQSRNADGPARPQPTIQPLSLALLATIRVPTLVLAGDADLLAPPPVARLLAQTIPGSEIKIIPECGHSAYWERPDLFNTQVLDFIARHGAVRTRG